VDCVLLVQPVVGSCEHGSEHLNSMKDGEFLDRVSDCRIFKACFPSFIYCLVKKYFRRSISFTFSIIILVGLTQNRRISNTSMTLYQY
jgi:hypothetical protein